MKRIKYLSVFALMFFSSAFADYKTGDLVQIPIEKGNFVLLLSDYGNVWYNSQTEWFQYEPIRNYGTVYVDITRHTPAGNYQFIEIQALDDPTNIQNWKRVNATDVRVVKCNDFRPCE